MIYNCSKLIQFETIQHICQKIKTKINSFSPLSITFDFHFITYSWFFFDKDYIIAPSLTLFFIMTPSLDILSLILGASLVVKAVMLILMLLSVFGWLLIFRLSARLSGARQEDAEFESQVWSGTNLNQIFVQTQNNQERSGLAQIFFVGYQEFLRLQKIVTNKTDLSDAIERKFRVGLGTQQGYLESGLPTLASIGSVSPYIGLFGTVWGIMTAFIGLGQAESVSLATVAPGIAEALIATAMGLFAAIPASLAFNHFTAKSAAIYEARALFCDELTGAIVAQYLQHRHLAQTQAHQG